MFSMKKNRMVWLPDGEKKFENMFSRSGVTRSLIQLEGHGVRHGARSRNQADITEIST